MRIRQEAGATYIDGIDNAVTPSKNLRKFFTKTVVFAVAFLLVGIFVASSMMLDGAMDAYAQEEEDDGTSEAKRLLDEAARSANVEDTQEGFYDAIRKAEDEGAFSRNGHSNNGSFFYALGRLFSPGYLNHTPDAVAQLGSSNPIYNCNSNDPANGTVVYHNCDVPNFMAEVMQNLVSLFVKAGSFSAESQKVALDNPVFGLPTQQMPTKTVPVSESDRSVKYTGLELFGYNLRISSYYGEWDDISTLNQARLLANFGLFDRINLTANTVFNSIGHALKNGGNQFTRSMQSGDVIGAISGFFGGFVSGGAAGAINTLLDTSDLNVFQTQGWFRSDFGSTTYGGRQLTQTELSAEAAANLVSAIQGTNPDAATLPDDFPPPTLPPMPKEAISKCEIIVNKNGTMQPYGNTNSAPGIDEATCRDRGYQNWVELYEDEDEEQRPGRYYVWSIDGTQKEETPAHWLNENADLMEGVEKYQVDAANISRNNPTRDQIVAFYNTYDSARATAAAAELEVQKVVENDNWLDMIVGAVFLGTWMIQNTESSFAAPHNQYICVKPNGDDLKGPDGQRLRVYESDGSLTGHCAGLRPPIQNGLFGNGYVAGGPNQNWSIDTRNELISTDFMDLVVSPSQISTSFANIGLTLSAFFTQISNTVINLAFGPLMEQIGVADRIKSLVGTLKDGLFMPLLALVVALAAITTFWSALVSRRFTEALRTLGIVAVTVVLGIMLLFNSDLVFNVVEEAPARVESAVLGTLFNVAADEGDPLCSASSVPGEKVERGLDGNPLDFNPNDSIRSLMCVNWKTFVFTPWLYGQWGTDFEKLYANGYAPATATGAMENSNEDLVGNAAVQFGGGNTVNNWAAYQLKVQASGTSTSYDDTKGSGQVDPNWYRIVDMQAGPNNGEGTDPRYLQAWSGNNVGDRFAIGALAPVVSFVGMLAIATFSFAKIKLDFLVTFMLLFLPIMLLFGIHPTGGRRKMKAYFGMLIGLVAQRIVLVALLAVMLTVMLGVIGAANGYTLITLVAVLIAIVFMMYRNNIMKLIQNAVQRSAGDFMQGRGFDAGRLFNDYAPSGVRNAAQQASAGAKGAAAGFVGGVASSGTGRTMNESTKKIFEGVWNRDASKLKEGANIFTTGMKTLAKDAKDGATGKGNLQQERMFSRQRVRGLAGWQTVMEADTAIDKEAQQRHYNSGGFDEAKEKLADRREETGGARDVRHTVREHRSIERVRKAHNKDRKKMRKRNAGLQPHLAPVSAKNLDTSQLLDKAKEHRDGYASNIEKEQNPQKSIENNVLTRYENQFRKKQHRKDLRGKIQYTLTTELQGTLQNIWGKDK